MARRNSDGGIVETIKTIIYAVLIAVLVRTFAYEPFNIPSGSMVPTLLIGDYLFVSKLSYGYSRYSLPFGLPLFDGRIFAETPKRGDVIVFKYPHDDSQDYIKRLIGLPGDTIQMHNGRLYINGKMVDRTLDGPHVWTGQDGRERVSTRYLETLPNGVVHYILEDGDHMPNDDTGLFKVPEGHYFMMGDNRDNSGDSRGQVGYVPAVNLVGRAEVLFFSTDHSARIWEVWKWFNAMRFKRFFNKINDTGAEPQS